jgi:hypothetical protein
LKKDDAEASTIQDNPRTSAIYDALTDWFYLKAGANHEDLLRDASHEVGHSFALRSFRLTTEESDGPTDLVRLQGYGNLVNKKFNFMNEIINEMLNLEMCADYLGRDSLNSQKLIGYYPGVIWFDILFKKVAERLGRNEQELRFDLYRGCLKGDHRALRVFIEALEKHALPTEDALIRRFLGSRSLRSLSALTENNYTPKELALYLTFLGLTKLEVEEMQKKMFTKIIQYEKGLETEIMGHVKIKCTGSQTHGVGDGR